MKRTSSIQIHDSKGGKFRVKTVGKNGEILQVSEPLNSVAAVKKNIIATESAYTPDGSTIKWATVLEFLNLADMTKKKVMKLATVIAFMLCAFGAQSQQLPTVEERITTLEDNLTACHKQYKAGVYVFVAGAVFTAINSYMVAQDEGDSMPALGIAGGVGMIVGGAIMIDSHKYLNVNRPTPTKK